MKRRRRPLAALALTAMVASIGACGSSAPTGSGSAGGNTAANAQKAVRFAECMRSNGVSGFPDPGASGKLTLDGVVNGSSLDPSSPAFKQAIGACKNLEPAGFTGSRRSPQQTRSALEFAAMHPRERRQGLSRPRQRSAPRRHESNPVRRNRQRHEHSQRRDEEVPRFRRGACGGPAVTRKTWVLAVAGVLAVAAATGGVAAMSGAKQATAAASQLPVGTAKVQRRTLSAVVSQAGTLTYRAGSDGSPYSVIDQTHGTYTELPAVGRVIRQGHVLYRVNDRPVALLHGSTPAYRSLSAGASGPDVRELNADLVALGYATRAELSPESPSFGPATTAAAIKLQATLGMTRNGTLTLGQVVFEPSSVRVTSVSAQLGGSAHAGETVMLGTSTIRQVQVALSASEQTTVSVGDKVSITLPNNQTTPGVVSSVGAVATCPSSSGPGGLGPGSATPGTDTCSSGGSGSSTPTIVVGVTPSHLQATRTWDQAPVQVGITTASVPKALVVPVASLLARSGGGYAVEVVGAGARNRLVPVGLGLFDDAEGLVQVTASRLAAGQEVVVPAT